MHNLQRDNEDQIIGSMDEAKRMGDESIVIGVALFLILTVVLLWWGGVFEIQPKGN